MPRSRLINAAINLGLVLVSTAVSLFAADLALRALKLPQDYASIMLLSGSKLSTDEHGVRRYEPSRDIEQAALINGELAYRYKYRSNNLGFVSPYDHQPGQTLDLAIVGDSMTEGQEVGPWLDKVQEHLFERHGKTSQNMAIAGNGFVEFERALAYAKDQLGARKAMILFIPDDLFRPGDRMIADGNCSMYRNFIAPDVVDCFAGRPTWHHYDAALSDTELAKFAESRQRFGLLRTLRRPAIETGKSVVRWLCRTGLRAPTDLPIAQRINMECQTDPPPQAASAPENGATLPIPAYVFTAMESILRLYGPDNVLMVMIPGGGGGFTFPDIQPQRVLAQALGGKFQSPLRFVDISESCVMPRELWAHRYNSGHPTAEGYRKLRSCVIENEEIMRFATQ